MPDHCRQTCPASDMVTHTAYMIRHTTDMTCRTKVMPCLITLSHLGKYSWTGGLARCKGLRG